MGTAAAALRSGLAAPGGIEGTELMNAREVIRRSYTVTVLPAEAGVYRLSYVPRGLMRSRVTGEAAKRAPEYKATAQVRGDEIQVTWDKAPADPEATPEDFDQDVGARVRTLRQWIDQLNPLVSHVREWAEELGWSVRVVNKPLEDVNIGGYKAPALVLQRDMTRVGLEPIGRSAPGVEGVVDLYVLPAYDDIASLLYYNDRWRLHHTPAGTPPVADKREAAPKPLTKKTFREVLDDMLKNGG